jgi:hypothetical protein
MDLLGADILANWLIVLVGLAVVAVRVRARRAPRRDAELERWMHQLWLEDNSREGGETRG